MPRVHFNDHVQVKYMYVWNTAYRLARKGPWMKMALDRIRFKKRIDKIDKKIGYIFQQEHRQQIKKYQHSYITK